ncbi:MAG: type IX secretion system sortase PorU [Chitinophagaceae bacterium]
MSITLSMPRIFSYCAFLFFVLFTSVLSAQKEIEKQLINQTKMQALMPQQAIERIDTNQLYKIDKIKINHFEKPAITLKNVVSKEMIGATNENISFPKNLEPHIVLSMENKQAFAVTLIPQYFQSNGKIYKVVSYDLDVVENNQNAQKTTGSRVYADHSVLASGQFYKIAVSESGLYKISFDFIKNNFGIDPSSINPSHIRVYGNGGTMLNESNAIARYDDLYENAIQVIDGNDGSFDSGDYILFYAQGPHAIVKDSINKTFYHQSNLYSDAAYYFLNFDKGNGKRVATIATPSTSNLTINTFQGLVYHEKDSSNPSKFGKNWYGEEFSDQPGRQLTRNFMFSLKNLITQNPVKISTRVGSIHFAGNSIFNVYANATPVHTISIPQINGNNFSDPVINLSSLSTSANVSSEQLDLQISYTKGSASAIGFLDYIDINYEGALNVNGYLAFRHWNSVGPSNIAKYELNNANAQTKIWDISNPQEPAQIPYTLNGSSITFVQEAYSLHEFLAFDGSITKTPTYVSKIANQDLHALVQADHIIITVPALMSEATRLAQHHSTKRGYQFLILTPEEIYNEFSSGAQDVSAIRDFLKMYYDRNSIEKIPRSVLFLGDASYDYKNRISNNTNLVPTYETIESVDKTLGYCTDDFFGFLDDHEDINNYSNSQINTLDIGIGRFPVSTLNDARNIVDKIISYDSPASFGPWKNNLTFNADDGDIAAHLDDAEYMAKFVADSMPVYNNYKIYVDGFVQQSTPAGPRTPDANQAVTAQMYNGTFLMNYNGHGGPLGWCEERIFSFDDIATLTNKNKLPLFITATCDFAPFDNPGIVSAGEILINKPDGGAIALMTTTQLVYADQNRIMNYNYMRKGFRLENGEYPTLGDAYRDSKNLRYVSSVDLFTASNFRKFALLGDPSLPLAFPKHVLKTDSINGRSILSYTDTLKALEKYTISGHIEDQTGNILDNFDGIVYPTVFDKPKLLTTLQNDGDPVRYYSVQNNALYKGKASIKNGKFSYTFVMPKDINYEIAKGKISYYGANESEDGNGYDKSIYIGGSSSNPNSDNAGPIIKAYMNDDKFVDGGIVTKNSILLIKLSDDNGINYTGNSVGHDITAILDHNAQKQYILNNFFEAELDDYRSGTIQFPVNNLELGEHSFTIKAWDVFNNSSEVTIRFVVTESSEAKIAHVYNYPNPFTTKTNFMFEHNMPNQNLDVHINIFSITGKNVKTIHTMVNTPGTRVNDISWDGKDEFGEKLGKGVYLYQLTVNNNQGFSDSQLQKLVLLQ